MSGTGAQSNNVGKTRDFLYLDFPRLTSYFAQINSGLLKHRSRKFTTALQETAATPEVETEGQGSISAAADIGVDDSPSLAQILGIKAELKAELEGMLRKAVRSGGDETQQSEAETLIETKELHHEVFESVVSVLDEKGLIAREIGSAAPIYEVSGRADILDISEVVRTMKDFGKIIGFLEGATGQKSVERPDKKSTDSSADMISYYLKDRVVILIHTENGSVSGFLNKKYLMSDLQDIIDNYGGVTDVDISMLGIVSRRSEIAPAPEYSSSNELVDKMLVMTRALDNMKRQITPIGDVNVYPIAVYVDL